jgi:hypothetical protein
MKKNTRKNAIICIVVVAALKAFSSDKESHSLQSTNIIQHFLHYVNSDRINGTKQNGQHAEVLR